MDEIIERFIANNRYDKAVAYCRAVYGETLDWDMVRDLRYCIQERLREDTSEELLMLYREMWFIASKEKLEDYFVALEWGRENKFYMPRRIPLYRVVQAMQRLKDGETDMLIVNLPPGTGKTTSAEFFMTNLAGCHPELAILGSSHSNAFLRGVYDECLRIMTSDEYNWGEIFKGHSVVRTNAQDLKIDVDDARRFSTFQFSSIGSGNAGKVRAMGLLYCDDLVEGIEEALSRERMDKKNQMYTTDLKQRKQGLCGELHIATPWSVNDVVGTLERTHMDDPRCEIVKIPALDENDESNFDYGGDLGFTTEYYHELRREMDDASWSALYMMQPIEREGLLYPESELRRYYELPDEEPDAVWAVCDTKNRGEDYCVMPIAYQYGSDYYIEEIICDDGVPEVVEPWLVDALVKHKVKMCRFESNAGGGRSASNVQEKVKEREGITKITTKYTTANKETRIIVNSPFVKEHCLFKDREHYNEQYRRAMSFLCSYTLRGKNKHDDVPDAFSMLADFVTSSTTNVLTIRQRLF